MQASVRTADGLIVQYGWGLGALEGCDVLDLADDEVAPLLEVMQLGADVKRNAAKVYDLEARPVRAVDV